MPRSKKPERYPAEFADLAVTAFRQGEVHVPVSTPSEAFGLRTKLYAFFAAIDAQIDSGPKALAARLVAARRIELAPGETPASDWVIERARDLLAAAADLEVTVVMNPGPGVLVQRKENNKFATYVRTALEASRNPGDSHQESLQRVLNQINEAKDE